MDYAALRQEGIRLLEQMTGGQWTDFNAHDPGITLLEQLCYVLTDLGYRIQHEIPDLLSDGGAKPYASLHPPDAILTMNPVTPDDLRKLALDVDGVKNAWVEPSTQDFALTFLPTKNELRIGSQDLSAQAISIRGLYRVLVDPSGDVDDAVLQGEVAKRLHDHRALCEDYVEITVLKSQPVQVEAIIEVAPIDDPLDLMSRIRQKLADEISPTVPFATLANMLEAGYRVDEIFDGPRLHRGFLLKEAMASASRRTVLHTSDLMHAINTVPGVRAVSRIRIAKGGAYEEWALPIDTDRVAKLDAGGLRLTLRRNGQVIVTPALAAADSARPAVLRSLENTNLLAPKRGRNRSVGTYSSMQQHLPALFGIGEMGLPDSASDERKAQARQLKAYLLFFDQLMANAFAQLAHARELFSFSSGPQTYFTQAVDHPGIGLDEVRTLDLGHRQRLQSLVEKTESTPALERKIRFLNHLLARFSEPVGEQVLAATLLERIAMKQSLLSDYPQLSGTRGTAYDALGSATSNRSGLETRLHLELDLHAANQEEVLVIEHNLLRPLNQDVLYDVQGRILDLQYPLLSKTRAPDPYSLQITFVFPDGAGRFAKPEFKQFVAQMVRQKLPAHLFPYIYWAEAADWEPIKAAYLEWQRMHRQFTASSVGVKLPATAATTTPVRAIDLRGARDRLIDLLGLGETYPLLDTGVRLISLTVDFQDSAEIEINPTQRNVRYELYEGDTAVGPSYVLDGDGTAKVLIGPAITVDHTYRILAYNLDRPERKSFLLTSVTAKIGLNHALPVWAPAVDIELPIIDYGSVVEIKVGRSQSGVSYYLLDRNDQEVSAARVIGNGGEISLYTVPQLEDTVLRVKAIRAFAEAEGRPALDTILDPLLPLAVRANPNVAVAVKTSQFCEYNGTATLQISASQSSVTYSAWVRKLRDADFVPTVNIDSSVLWVAVADHPDVKVIRPARPAEWTVQAEYTMLAQAVGKDGLLELPISELTEDCVVVLQAHKDHLGVFPAKTDLQLVQPALVLVRPAPMLELTLQLTPAADGQSGELLVQGGQPGVFYYFTRTNESTLLGLGAYFHKLDDGQSLLSINRGFDLIRLDRDLVVARPQTDSADLATQPPLPPQVTISPLPEDGSLQVMAVKERNGLAWLVQRTIPVTTTS